MLIEIYHSDNFVVTLKTFPLNLSSSIFLRRISWFTVSKAFAILMNVANVNCLRLMALKISLVKRTVVLIVELFFLKPPW